MKIVIRNIFIAVLFVTLFTCWDIAHTPKTEVKAQVVSEPVATVPTPRPGPKTEFIKVKVSHYWPDLGGVNCLNFKNGKCVSKMANGKKWESHVGEAIACPPELKMGTKIRILDRVWTCMDRGSMIVKEGNAYWVDQLTPYALVPYGTEVEAEMYLD